MAVLPVPLLAETQQSRRLSTLDLCAEGLLELASEPNVEDVVVNPDETLWVNRTGEGFQCVGKFPEHTAQSILLQVAFQQELPFGPTNPILETDLPRDGSRITGLRSPVVRGVAITIRPHPKRRFTRQDYIDAGIITHKDDILNQRTEREEFLDKAQGKDHGEILSLAVEHRQNIVVGGSTGSGKTTALNMVFSEIGLLCPSDRIVGIEDTRELQWDGIRNHVSLLASPQAPTHVCLEKTLRLKPHRIVVGEVRTPAAATTLIEAWNTGHRGGLTTVHADDAVSTLQRLEELTRSQVTSEAIGRAVNVVLFFDECRSIRAGRKLKEVLIVRRFNSSKRQYDFERV